MPTNQGMRIVGVVVEDGSKTHHALAIGERMVTLSREAREEIKQAEQDTQDDYANP